MVKKYKYIIGIDPDLHRSGIAMYDVEKKEITQCASVSIWELFDSLKTISKDEILEYLIRLEYPNSTNTWHKGGKGAALNVGKNQAVAIIIKEFLEEYNYNFELLAPHGYSQIFKDEDVFREITKWQLRTNTDSRAACAMCWGY